MNIWGYFKALLTPYGQSQDYSRLNSNSQFVEHQNLDYFNGKLKIFELVIFMNHGQTMLIWIIGFQRTFKGPSKAVKANLQTLFTNKQQALRIIPKEKPDHLSVLPIVIIICSKTESNHFSDISSVFRIFRTKIYSEVNFN